MNGFGQHFLKYFLRNFLIVPWASGKTFLIYWLFFTGASRTFL